MKRGFLYNISLVTLLFFASCSATKYVPEGKYLLDDVKIVSDNKDIKTSSFQNYLRQTPNSKWFSLVKIPLYTYSLSGRDSTKWINRVLKRMGDAPVVYDEVATLRSEEELEKALHNMGYMSAAVATEAKFSKKKKMKLTYKLAPGRPYYINSVEYDIKDKNIRPYFRNDSIHLRLKEGMICDVNLLDEERQRITNYLLRKGYYHFNKEFVTYTADTIRNTYLVDLRLHVSPFRTSAEEESSPHRQYRIHSVNFILDNEDASRAASLTNININDSLHIKGYPVYFKDSPFIRPKVLADNTRIFPGRLYNELDVQNTYASFGRLRALKYTNIRFSEKKDSLGMLDCYIMLTQGKYKSITAELEGTNSAGDLGAAASLSFQHRNIFKGSETFTVKVRGAYEAISGIQNSTNNNYTEYGVETSLNFPSFMFPFLSSDFKRRIRATSEVGVQYNAQMRPEFSRTVASASWSYRWSRKQRIQHTIDLIDINYAYSPWKSAEFEEHYFNNNSLLKYSFDDLLIVRAGYSFNFNSIGSFIRNKAFENSYSIRVNLESAGNTLYGLSKLTKQSLSDDGKYKIGNIAYAQFIKGDFDFAKNITIDDRNSLAFHIGIGIAYPYGNSDILPFEKRYFSGGANSVRGWSVRTLGPGTFKGEDKNIDFMKQSGDIKLDANIEYRTSLFWKLQGAAFIDAGNIWTIHDYEDQPGGAFRFKTFYKQLAVAYGLGIRLDFDFFILRFDGGMKAINPVYTTTKEHYPIISPKFGRDFAFHFAVGYPF